MKYIFNNIYIKVLSFESFGKYCRYIDGIPGKKFHLEGSYGDKYYTFLVKDSLSQENLFIYSFQSDYSKNDLAVLFWEKAGLIVLHTGTYLYFIDRSWSVKFSFEISTVLIGFHITKDANLLIMQEASITLINSDGKKIKAANFDLIENFRLEEETLFLFADEEQFEFKLSA